MYHDVLAALVATDDWVEDLADVTSVVEITANAVRLRVVYIVSTSITWRLNESLMHMKRE